MKTLLLSLLILSFSALAHASDVICTGELSFYEDEPGTPSERVPVEISVTGIGELGGTLSLVSTEENDEGYILFGTYRLNLVRALSPWRLDIKLTDKLPSADGDEDLGEFKLEGEMFFDQSQLRAKGTARDSAPGEPTLEFPFSIETRCGSVE